MGPSYIQYAIVYGHTPAFIHMRNKHRYRLRNTE